MAKEFWLNLPVKNVKKSKEFFTKLGFKFSEHYGNGDQSAALLIGEKSVVVMLFDEQTFRSFTSRDITDTTKSGEMLLSFDAQSKEEVDEITMKAVAAGGTSNHKPSAMQGWMYGSGFYDLDGHGWNVLYMDMDKMPKPQ